MNVKEQIHELRKMLDRGDVQENIDEQLDKILNRHSAEALRELLFFRAYREEADTLEEMWMILRAVESFPKSIYFSVLAECLGMFCLNAPWFAMHVLARISNGESDTNQLVANLSSSHLHDEQAILDVLTSIDDGQRKPAQLERLRRIRDMVVKSKKAR